MTAMTDFTGWFTYNPILVILSVVVAIQAGYVGISLALFIPTTFANHRRFLIAGSALTLAVGIWSMHFIGMLAVKTSIPIDYGVLPTLLSFLICGLVTGVAVYLASLRSQFILVLAAVLMGLGITTMHYVGMRAVHSVMHMTHDPVYAVASIAIAIAASGITLWLAFSAHRRPPLFLCALVFGCAVSGMHYTAMAGTTLDMATTQATTAKSLISSDILATIVSVVACSISAVFMLALIPAGAKEASSKSVPSPPVAPSTPEHPADLLADGALLLPTEKNGKRCHIAPGDIASVHSNAHYTYIFNGREDLFCPLSITDIAARLPEGMFPRTHRSYIVNLAFVVRIRKSGDAGVVELDTPVRRTVPVSRSRLAALREELAAFKVSAKTSAPLDG
jgi:diguanylate cyclase